MTPFVAKILMGLVFVALWLCLLLGFSAGCVPVASRQDPEARVKEIGSELRCPVCRGVSIADSPSALAQEMMATVRQQVAEGKSDQEILRFFVDRYGEWILLEPEPHGANLLIWILPVFVLLGGVVLILLRAKKMEEEAA